MENSQEYAGARNGLLARVLSIFTILAVLVSMWAFAAPQTASAVGNIEEIHDDAAPNVDARAGRVQPTLAQTQAVSRMGASVRWNKFGTPHSLIKYGDYLATGLSGATAKDAAFNWIVANQGLFRLANVNTNSLRLLNDSRMTDGYDPATGKTQYTNGDGHEMHAVMFRQYFGGLAAVQDGMITVGIVGTRTAGWKIAYVSSSLTGSTAMAAQPAITASQAWLKSAAAAGVTGLTASSIQRAIPDRNKNGTLRSNWTLLQVQGFLNPQRVRLTALPTPLNGVRPAYQTIFLRNENRHADAYTSFVDAVTGQVLFRNNNVQQFADFAPQAAPTTQPFQGAYTATTCTVTPPGGHNFMVGAGVKSIIVVAQPAVLANDIVIILTKPDGTSQRQDLLTSPEVLTFNPDGDANVPTGTYNVKVCPFNAESNFAPFNYVGTFTTSDEDVPGRDSANPVPYPPKWKYFRSNPPLTSPFRDDLPETDTRILACWDAVVGGDIEGDDDTAGTKIEGCQQDLDYVGLRSSKAPWDMIAGTDAPSFTTFGNNALPGEAQLNANTPVTGAFGPGLSGFRPVSANREYSYPWTNQWNRSKCNPAVIQPAVSPDVSAAVTNLFVFHNRMHDWSYYLGFTEENFNMQMSNFGNGTPDRAGDPEVGAVQAGALDGGFAGLYGGRDNANQFTLADGIPPITNMYLWQPIVGAFYAPCVDGDFDMSVVGHEYGHAIQNRMIGGPDMEISSEQGSQMGESWSDLTAVEFLFGFGYSQGLDRAGYPAGVNPFAVGPYVTGALQRGIRNYGMNFSPLNFSNLEYDPSGLAADSPHSNGEIWSAVNYNIRQELINKYNVPRFGYPAFPVTDKGLQQDCVAGRRPARFCPGNRRWIQIFHDAFLLLPSSISMLDARDAYLAADMMRFRGFNQTELWRAFARRGMGVFAFTEDGNSNQSTPNFRSPREGNTSVTFNVTPQATGGIPLKAKIYVGDYEARATPIADTNSATRLGPSAAFVGGTYKFLVVAPGYGFQRFTRTFAPGARSLTLNVSMPVNFASRINGAVATGDGLNKNRLIDDTETTNFASLDRTTGKAPSGAGDQVRGKQVTVKLAGGARMVTHVQVSALTRPANEMDVAADDDPPSTPVGDIDSQSTFTALRQFEILTCRATGTTATTNCSTPAQFTKIYTSPANAFPAGRPRPSTAELLLRPFDVPDTTATHVRIQVVSNQCTGAPDFNIDEDADPLNPSPICRTFNGNAVLSRKNNVVRISELQVFTGNATVR